MSNDIDIDIAKCICEFLDVKSLVNFVASCKTFHTQFQYLSGKQNLDIIYLSTSQLVVKCDSTEAVIHNIIESNLVIYNCHFTVSQTMSIQHSSAIFVNCSFHTQFKTSVFHCTNSQLQFINSNFVLSNKLGKGISSEIRMTNCHVFSKMKTHPLLVLRLSSAFCDTVTTKGGNVFCFVNGRPDFFSFRNCHCSSEHGVEWHNCRVQTTNITNCNATNDFSVTTTNTNHFFKP